MMVLTFRFSDSCSFSWTDALKATAAFRLLSRWAGKPSYKLRLRRFLSGSPSGPSRVVAEVDATLSCLLWRANEGMKGVCAFLAFLPRASCEAQTPGPCQLTAPNHPPSRLSSRGYTPIGGWVYLFSLLCLSLELTLPGVLIVVLVPTRVGRAKVRVEDVGLVCNAQSRTQSAPSPT